MCLQKCMFQFPEKWKVKRIAPSAGIEWKKEKKKATYQNQEPTNCFNL